MKKAFILIAISLFGILELFAQKSEDEFKVHKIGGKEYYIHMVDSGNTLYAISRMYAISIEDLKTENPRLTESLTIGDRLLIPVKDVKRRDLKSSPDIDGNFLVYEIQKKNTLYSISKEFHVEINDIIAANPEIEDGLKKGMKIKIPVDKIKSSEQDAQFIAPADASPYVTHRVVAKETLYALSKKYLTTVDSILLVNNGLPGGLKVGELINIPVLRDFKDSAAYEEVKFDSSAIKSAYKIALFLPFYFDRMESVEDSSFSYQEIKKKTKKLHHKAQYAIEFYQGFKIAADSLVEQGLQLKLYTFDTGNDSSKVADILRDSAMKELDLIIGPLFINNFLMVADFAKKHGINIVSPVKLSNKILLGNDHVSKVYTSNPVLDRFLGVYTYDSLRFDNLLLAYPDHVKDRKKAETIKREYYRMAESSNDTMNVNALKEMMLDDRQMESIRYKLDTSKLNTIVVPSSNPAFVTQLLTTLYQMDDYRIRLVGLSEWENFENIEVDYLNRLNVHLVVSEYIDHESESTRKFDKEFFARYRSLPIDFSYLGFDVGYYYLSLLKNFGVNFEVMFLGVQSELLSRKFEFFKTGIESGYENHSSFVIRYQDSQKKRVY